MALVGGRFQSLPSGGSRRVVGQAGERQKGVEYIGYDRERAVLASHYLDRTDGSRTP